VGSTTTSAIATCISTANHAAWLEDHRRRSNGGNAMALLGGALAHGVSRVWAGYWQRQG